MSVRSSQLSAFFRREHQDHAFAFEFRQCFGFTELLKVVGEALANPTTGKLKDLATILGDVGATKVEIYQSAVDEDLARSALGEDPDGAE